MSEKTVPAFDDFVRHRYAALHRYATSLSQDPAGADDLVQDALVSAYKHWCRLENPEAYLTRIIGRGAYRLRKLHPRPTMEVEDTGSLDRQMHLVEERDLALRALRSLPSKQRTVVVLRYLYDMSERDVAQALDISVGTVKSQLSRAISTLRKSQYASRSLGTLL